MKDQLDFHTSQLSYLQSLVSSLLSMVEDAENWHRRIIRVVDLPERVEGSPNPPFKQLLDMPNIICLLVMLWRGLTGSPLAIGAPTRLFLEHFLNFHEGDIILAEARKRQELPF